MAKKQEEKEAKETIKRGDATELNYVIPGLSYHSTWSSPEAFARDIRARGKKDHWHDSGWEEGDGSWKGTKTMEDALALAAKGWPEGAAQIEKTRLRVLASNPTLPRAIKYGIAGAVPNVPRAVSGNILNMKAQDLAKSRRRPVITLVANMSANCGVDSKAISNRAAVAAAVIDQIESAGYSCEVIATALSSGNSWDGKSGFTAATSIIVKEAGQPVDTGRLAFSMGHSSMFRRFVFSDWGSAPCCQSGLGHGLGSSHGLEKDASSLTERGIYMLASAEGNSEYFKDEEVSSTLGIDLLISELQKQGCPAFEKYESPIKEEDKIKKKKRGLLG